MAERRLGSLVLLFGLCLSLLTGYGYAASVADAVEPIAAEKGCALTISYRLDDQAFSGMPVKLYRIAEVSVAVQYTPVSSFQGADLTLNGIQSNAEWSVIRSTLVSYILANGIAPDLTTVTDQAGKVSYDALKPGLYLAVAEPVTNENMVCVFDSALIALPGLGADGRWQYQVAVAAKGRLLPLLEPDGETQLKVLKLWKGDEGQNVRPESIEVEIFRSGMSVQTVILSEQNHWSYSWVAEDDGTDWMVVERNIPTEYSVTVEERGGTFILTNVLRPVEEQPQGEETRPTDSPKTGDTPHILLYTVLMYLSGDVLLIFGLTGKRKDT